MANDNPNLKKGTFRKLFRKLSKLEKREYLYFAPLAPKEKKKNKNNPKNELLDAVKLRVHFLPYNTTHYTGLEHLPTIISMVTNTNGNVSNSLRARLKQMIMKGTFNEKSINNSQKDFIQLHTSLSQTDLNNKYTIFHRINILFELNKLLSDKKTAANTYLFTDWNTVESNIKADYVLSMNHKTDKNERVFVYLQKMDNSSTSDVIDVKVVSVFSDSKGKTRCQSRPQKISCMKMYTKDSIQNIYTSPEYAKQLENVQNKSIKITKAQTNSFKIQNNITPTSNGTAVLQAPAIPMIQPPSFDNLSKDIRNIFNKIKNALDNLTKPSKQTKSNTNKKNTQKSKQSATNKQRTTNRSSSQGARKSTVKTASKSKEKSATKQPEQPKKPTFRISRSKMNENAKKVNQKNKSSEKGTRSKNKNNNIDL